MSEVNSGTTIFCERNQREHVFWLLQNLGCIGSSLIEKQWHVLECLDVYWDNRWFNCESRLILTYFEYILYNYTKYTQRPGYSLSVDRTISDTNVPKVCQLFNLACQCAKSLLIFQLGVPKCQTACQFFILACQRAKRRAKLSNISLTKC